MCHFGNLIVSMTTRQQTVNKQENKPKYVIEVTKFIQNVDIPINY